MKELFTSSRAGGALALLVFAIFLMAGGLLAGQSLVDTKGLEAEARTTEMQALQKRVQLPVLPAAPSNETKNAFLAGSNLALAANTLQQRIAGLIDSSGGTLATIGVDPPDSNDDAAGLRVVVQAKADFDNDALQKFIYELESERPFVLIDTLEIRRVGENNAQDGGKQNPLRLTVTIRVISYYRRAAR